MLASLCLSLSLFIPLSLYFAVKSWHNKTTTAAAEDETADACVATVAAAVEREIVKERVTAR